MKSLRRRVLVIAAHPDDEVLGCGGTIASHALSKDEVHILIVGEGLTSRSKSVPDKKMHDLHQASARAGKFLGAKSVANLGFSDNRLDDFSQLEIIQAIEHYAFALKPQVIYTHDHSDLNRDHQIVHDAVLTAFRPLPESSVEEILCFEVLSSTHWSGRSFEPNVTVDISKTISKKIGALKFYKSEMRKFPHARSYESVSALAKVRGSIFGFRAGEAFRLVWQKRS